MNTNQSLFDRAQITTPGGVNSPVRAFRSVGGVPRFISHAKGLIFGMWRVNDISIVLGLGAP